MPTLDSVIDEIKPVVRRATICVRGDLVDRIRQLAVQAKEQARADEESNEPDRAPELWAQVAELREQAKAHEHEFTFASIGVRAWGDLAAEYPPTEEQRKSYAAMMQLLDHNPKTFPAAAMGASCTHIDGEPAEASHDSFLRLERKVTRDAWQRLWEACYAANTEADDLGKSVAATAPMRPSPPSSTTAANGASPDRSSSAGS